MARDTTNRGRSRLTGATFGDRLAALKGDLSYHELARQMQKAGLNVTAQGLHKWVFGGGISVENLKDVADFFEVSPVFLYFGETSDTSKMDSDDMTPDARLVARAWSLLPERFRTPLAVDIYKLTLALTDKRQDPALHINVKQALERLTKGSS